VLHQARRWRLIVMPSGDGNTRREPESCAAAATGVGALGACSSEAPTPQPIGNQAEWEPWEPWEPVLPLRVYVKTSCYARARTHRSGGRGSPGSQGSQKARGTGAYCWETRQQRLPQSPMAPRRLARAHACRGPPRQSPQASSLRETGRQPTGRQTRQAAAPRPQRLKRTVMITTTIAHPARDAKATAHLGLGSSPADKAEANARRGRP
jgi:hypothetical protein